MRIVLLNRFAVVGWTIPVSKICTSKALTLSDRINFGFWPSALHFSASGFLAEVAAKQSGFLSVRVASVRSKIPISLE